MYEVKIVANFSAAHHLRGYAGECAAVHGHNWSVEVGVCGESLNKLGMLVDFRSLKDTAGKVVREFDHADLNSLPCFSDENPTSENIARILYERISSAFDTAGARVSRVTVRETQGTEASYVPAEPPGPEIRA